MNSVKLLGAAALAAVLLVAGPAFANSGPPAGTVVLNFDGAPIPHGWTQYTTSFVATGATTNLAFALRDDHYFLFLDDVSLSTGGGANLVINGGFETPPFFTSTPSGWSYLNPLGAVSGGTVTDVDPHSGFFHYYDGAEDAYDVITQAIGTVSGQTYDLSFWLGEDSPDTTFSALATNGGTGFNGNAVNLVVYANAGPTGGIPEPATWAVMLVGFGGLGVCLRRNRGKAARAIA